MKREDLNLCLISGAPGVGKSSVNNKLRVLTHSLISIADFDDVKEVLRGYYRSLSEKGIGFDPVLFQSFFELSLEDYLRQSEMLTERSLNGMIEGSIERIRIGAIVSGAHLIPGKFDAAKYPKVNTTQILLVVSDEQEHWRRFSKRTQLHDKRPYMQSGLESKFQKIRNFQNYLIGMAKQSKIPIIECDDKAAGKIIAEMQKKATFPILDSDGKQ